MFENVKAFINMREHFSHESLDKDTKLIQSTFILSLDQKLTVDGSQGSSKVEFTKPATLQLQLTDQSNSMLHVAGLVTLVLILVK